MYFHSSTFGWACVLFIIVFGPVAAGMAIGRRISSRPEPNRESVGVVQGTLLAASVACWPSG